MHGDPEILLVEDTPTMQVLYLSILQKAGRSADAAGTIEEARGLLAQRSYRVILLDLNLPDGDGLELLEEVQIDSPGTQIIVITANGSLNKAIHAMRSGAMDFLVKPFSGDKLLASVDRAIDAQTAMNGDAGTEDGFAGTSQAIRALRIRIAELARSDASVFVFGEEGLDKDYLAGLLHKNSPYSRGPLIELDCTTDAPNGPDGDLFAGILPHSGPARRMPEDIFDHLRGSTLILKEVCDLGVAHQLELLRFLQWMPDGFIAAEQPGRQKVRIISTSTRDPLAEVRAGRFRRDLLAKLYEVPLTIPPLRDRKEDIVPCAEEFLRLLALRRNLPAPVLSPAAMDVITDYPWPRNIKQLQAVLETAVSLYSAEVIDPDMLGEEVARFARSGLQPVNGSGQTTIAPDLAVDNLVGLTLSEVEKRFIEATIDRCKGSVPKAAEILNVAPSTLYRKLESWQNSSVD